MDVDGARAALRSEYAPVETGTKAMDVYLRLLAEQAGEALAAHDLARLASEAERLKRLKTVA